MHLLVGNIEIEEKLDEFVVRNKVENKWGKILREMGPGLAFGEKALTENSPRTVSIISKTVSHLLIFYKSWYSFRINSWI